MPQGRVQKERKKKLWVKFREKVKGGMFRRGGAAGVVDNL
jgi:hypothetical protein